MDGFPRRETQFQAGDEIVANLPADVALEEDCLFSNLKSIGESNGFEQQMTLEVDKEFKLESASNDSWRNPDYTIERETGIGKTYVYLKTTPLWKN